MRSGDVIAEIAERPTARVSGIDRINQLIASSVEFVMELDQQEWLIGLENVKR